MQTDIDHKKTDVVTNCAGGPVTPADLHWIIENIRESSPSLTSVYALSDKPVQSIVGWSLNPRRESPLRSMQFEGIGLTFVVSEKMPPGQLHFYKDVFDDYPVAAIYGFSLNRLDYPTW